MKKILIGTISFYQNFISGLIGPCCRFHPTCSEYAIESLKSHVIIKVALLTLKRISKCHPWGSHGYDPIQSKKIKNNYE